MKIAIHHRRCSFSDCWIKYCKNNSIDYKVVNAFDSDITQQLKDCQLFLWHYSHAIYEDVIASKKILFALEQAGMNVYPNFNTGWHFDDKISQKYILESINAPLIPSYVFYNKKAAVDWINQASFPMVFKLKGGAGGANVSLVKTRKEAIKLTQKAFGKGFSQHNGLNYLKDCYQSYKYVEKNNLKLIKAIARLAIPTKFSRLNPPEKGYIYFQEFIPNNSSDIRIVIINANKAVAERRLVRPNDFRASGSGLFSYTNINLEAVKIAFVVAEKLKLQSVAFDFVIDEDGSPLIVEMSYAFGTEGISNAKGYWDSSLTWHESKINLQEWLLTSLLEGISCK